MISRKQLEEIARAVQGVPVWGCLPGSTAADAGIGYGDIVIAVNGVATPGIDEYLAARQLRADGYELRLFRDGRERTVFVAFRPPSDSLTALATQIAEGRYVPPSESQFPPPKSTPS